MFNWQNWDAAFLIFGALFVAAFMLIGWIVVTVAWSASLALGLIAIPTVIIFFALVVWAAFIG